MSFDKCPECGEYVNEDGDDDEIMWWCDNINQHKDRRQWCEVYKWTEDDKRKIEALIDWFDYKNYPLESQFRWG